MANRNFPSQRQFSFHLLPVKLDFSISITGSSGALGATANPGKGIASVTRLSTGVYQFQLQDNYASYLDANFNIQSRLGSSAAVSAVSTGTVYSISSLGTTSQSAWVTAGVPSGITAQVGTIFKAASTAATGTGNVKPILEGNLYDIEIVGNPNLMLNNQPFNAGQGGYITFGCLGPGGASTATPTFTDPASGTVITGSIFLNNSQIQ